MISAISGEGHRPVYRLRVLDNGANSRVKALGRLSGAGVEFVYVSNRDVNVAPFRNLVIEPMPNPFGVLRTLGLHRLKSTLDSVAYFPTRHRLVCGSGCKQVEEPYRRRSCARQASGGADLRTPACLVRCGPETQGEIPEIRWVIDWQDLWSHDEVYFNAVFPRIVTE